MKGKEGGELRRRLGFADPFPRESGLRYLEKPVTPALQCEIDALWMAMLYPAGLLPTCPEHKQKVTLSFDGMLHQARSHMRGAASLSRA